MCIDICVNMHAQKRPVAGRALRSCGSWGRKTYGHVCRYVRRQVCRHVNRSAYRHMCTHPCRDVRRWAHTHVCRHVHGHVYRHGAGRHVCGKEVFGSSATHGAMPPSAIDRPPTVGCNHLAKVKAHRRGKHVSGDGQQVRALFALLERKKAGALWEARVLRQEACMVGAIHS